MADPLFPTISYVLNILGHEERMSPSIPFHTLKLSHINGSHGDVAP